VACLPGIAGSMLERFRFVSDDIRCAGGGLRHGGSDISDDHGCHHCDDPGSNHAGDERHPFFHLSSAVDVGAGRSNGADSY